MDIEDTHRPLSKHCSPQFNSTLFHTYQLTWSQCSSWAFAQFTRAQIEFVRDFTLVLLRPTDSFVQKLWTKAKWAFHAKFGDTTGVFLWYFHREFLFLLNCFSLSWDYSVHTHPSLSDTQLGREEEGQTDRAKIISLDISCLIWIFCVKML